MDTNKTISQFSILSDDIKLIHAVLKIKSYTGSLTFEEKQCLLLFERIRVELENTITILNKG